MQIATLYDKGSRELNEDALLVAESRFGVFDGATSLDGYMDAAGKTGGYLASNLARETFEAKSGPLRDIALQANERIQQAMQQQGIDTLRKEGLWSTSAAVVDVSSGDLEWVQIADSLILLLATDGSSRLLTPHGDHDAETLSLWKELGDKKVMDIRSHLAERLLALRRTANVAYGVLNGDPAAQMFLNSGREPLTGIAHVLIFTDGFFIPKKDPRAPDDFDAMARLFLGGGLEAVKEHVRSVEAADPHCWDYPRYKQYDDMAAIALSF